MKSEQMMVKVLNVLSYAREKYKNNEYWIPSVALRKIKNGFGDPNY